MPDLRLGGAEDDEGVLRRAEGI